MYMWVQEPGVVAKFMKGVGKRKRRFANFNP